MAKQHLFFFDVETTGLPKGRNISYKDYHNWPRIVSICWLITDHKGKVLEEFYELIKPKGFTIPKDVEAIHGISTNRAQRDGIALDKMLKALDRSLNSYNLSHLVAHNIEFDRNVLFSELVRNNNLLLSRLSILSTACTMKSSTNFCKLPHKNRRYGGYKWPKLSELHKKLFQTGILLEHDAREDILATKRCFFKLQEMGVMKVPLKSSDSNPREERIKAHSKIKDKQKQEEIVKQLNAAGRNRTEKTKPAERKAKVKQKRESVAKKLNATVKTLKNESEVSNKKIQSNKEKELAEQKQKEIVKQLNKAGRNRTKEKAKKRSQPLSSGSSNNTEKKVQSIHFKKNKRSKKILIFAILFWLIAFNPDSGFVYLIAFATSIIWFFSNE